MDYKPKNILNKLWRAPTGGLPPHNTPCRSQRIRGDHSCTPYIYIVLVWNKLLSVHCSVPDYIPLFRSFHIGEPSERHAAQPTNNPAATSNNLVAASTTNNPAATSNNLAAASTTNSCKSAAP